MKRRHDGANSVDVNIEVTNSSSTKSSGKKRAKSKAPNQVELSNYKEEEKAPEQKDMSDSDSAPTKKLFDKESI